MDWNNEFRLEEKHIQMKRNVQQAFGEQVAKWVGNFQRKDLPDDGWVELARIAYDGKKRDCSRCDYPDLKNAVLIEHPKAGKREIVGPHCLVQATRPPLAI